MRMLWVLLIFVSAVAMTASGCGEPKPLDDSKFDKAAYDDVNQAGKALSDDKAVTQ